MKALTLLAVLLLVLLGAAAPAGGDPLTAYHHRTTTVTYPCREWVTLGSVPVPDRGQVTVSAQIPLEARSRHARVRFLRLPQRDGTGDLDVLMTGRGRWHVTHSHTVRAWGGRMAVQARVWDCRTWTSPYLVVKAYAG